MQPRSATGSPFAAAPGRWRGLDAKPSFAARCGVVQGAGLHGHPAAGSPLVDRGWWGLSRRPVPGRFASSQLRDAITDAAGGRSRAGRPLSVDRLDIPIDHRGTYEVSLGEASLANGVATLASFAFVDAWPLDVSLARRRPDQPPLARARRETVPELLRPRLAPGVERVEAVARLRRHRSEPGAVLSDPRRRRPVASARCRTPPASPSRRSAASDWSTRTRSRSPRSGSSRTGGST